MICNWVVNNVQDVMKMVCAFTLASEIKCIATVLLNELPFGFVKLRGMQEHNSHTTVLGYFVFWCECVVFVYVFVCWYILKYTDYDHISRAQAQNCYRIQLILCCNYHISCCVSAGRVLEQQRVNTHSNTHSLSHSHLHLFICREKKNIYIHTNSER